MSLPHIDNSLTGPPEPVQKSVRLKPAEFVAAAVQKLVLQQANAQPSPVWF